MALQCGLVKSGSGQAEVVVVMRSPARAPIRLGVLFYFLFEFCFTQTFQTLHISLLAYKIAL